jgi:hypothetical protein
VASSSGSLENLKVSVCQGLTSCSAHTRATVLWLIPSWSTSRRLDQWVTTDASVEADLALAMRAVAQTACGRGRGGG